MFSINTDGTVLSAIRISQSKADTQRYYPARLSKIVKYQDYFRMA